MGTKILYAHNFLRGYPEARYSGVRQLHREKFIEYYECLEQAQFVAQFFATI
jgi:hypothetical protein